MTPIFLLLVSLLLIFLEFFLPGAIMGAVGGILYISSIALFLTGEYSAVEIFLFFIFALVSLVFTIKFALHRVKNSSVESGLYSSDDQEGYVSCGFPKELIGLEGVACSNLSLSGYIEVKGEEHQAISDMRYVKKGERIQVIGGRGAYLVVIKVDHEKN